MISLKYNSCFRCKHFNAPDYNMEDGTYKCTIVLNDKTIDDWRVPERIVNKGYCDKYVEISIDELLPEHKVYYYTGVIYK